MPFSKFVGKNSVFKIYRLFKVCRDRKGPFSCERELLRPIRHTTLHLLNLEVSIIEDKAYIPEHTQHQD